MKKKNIAKKVEGYSLIEIVLIMMMISIVFVSFYGFYYSAIGQNEENQREIIASNLAQEGIEMIRNERDENALGDPDKEIWEGIDGFTGDNIKLDEDGRYCQIDVLSCGSNPTSTPFARTCSFSTSTDEDDGLEVMDVKCTVTWDSLAAEGVEREATARSILTNWQN